MKDGVSIEIVGTEKIDQALKRLHELSARKRDVTDVFRRSMKPLISAGRSAAPIGSSRLRRSIKFTTSKKYKNVWYVRAGRNKSSRAAAYYAQLVGQGHVTRNGKTRVQPNPFMDRAWNSVGGQVLNDLEIGLWQLGQRLWEAK